MKPVESATVLVPIRTSRPLLSTWVQLPSAPVELGVAAYVCTSSGRVGTVIEMLAHSASPQGNGVVATSGGAAVGDHAVLPRRANDTKARPSRLLNA